MNKYTFIKCCLYHTLNIYVTNSEAGSIDVSQLSSIFVFSIEIIMTSRYQA